ncbi:MAG: hypothetical protein RLZZ612_2266 [Pseudomonadota bacterium]
MRFHLLPSPSTSHLVFRVGHLVSLLSLGLLSACGGGEEYTPTVIPGITDSSGTTTAVDEFAMVTNTESLATMRKGDTWMYEWTNRTTGTGYYSTHYLSALDPKTQLYTVTVSFSDDQIAQIQQYGSNNALSSMAYGDTLCRYEPQSRAPFPRRPYVPNATWNMVWRESCLTGTFATTVEKTINGRILSLTEPLTLGLLGQGSTAVGGSVLRTFDTIKYAATRTDTTTEGTWTYQDTCWHDKAQDRTVKCDTLATYVPRGETTPTLVQEREQRLAFVREIRTPSPVLLSDGPSSLAVYAGRWNFKLVATGGTLTCPQMSISFSGQIKGNCVRVTTTGAQQAPFSVSGFITRQNITTQVTQPTSPNATTTKTTSVTRAADVVTVVADSNPNDLSLTGEMRTPLYADGTWIGATGSSGSWVAQRY